MNNRNRTLLQLLVDGGKASGYKEDLSIRFGDRKERCALYFKTLMLQNKGSFMAFYLLFPLNSCIFAGTESLISCKFNNTESLILCKSS
ncbi:hypothetical protein SAMN02745202_00690 [Segatella oulorum]|uniref:Uncharacterized protein n=1 Tax=Segatella oulorum TaxID=28136 RepID=A0A1T4MBI7_9BACT|nr:hypothetical protein SAMN02745202_00690 [Segatella oulorum]